jgi:dTDP-4-amino-4,6-dideoxygalactose transaminase
MNLKRTPVFDNTEWELISEVLCGDGLSKFVGTPDSSTAQDLSKPTSLIYDLYKNKNASFFGGPMIRRFERNFTNEFYTPFAVSMNSATSGLVAALLAVGVKPGDEVVVPTLSFSATAASIAAVGAVPVFVDIVRSNYGLDPYEFESAITQKTRAVIVVHFAGLAAHMNEIMSVASSNGIYVIEDCAQALGTIYKNDNYVGKIGHVGVFSFNEGKNITTGEGGMVVTDHPEIAKYLRLIRNHGETVGSNIAGYNFRMTELQAAIGIGQLYKLDKYNAVRQSNVRTLYKNLGKLKGMHITNFGIDEVPHFVPFVYDDRETGVSREKIIDRLSTYGVPAISVGYNKLMHEFPLYGKQSRKFPVAHDLFYRTFIWFFHIGVPNSTSEMVRVARGINQAFKDYNLLLSGSV